MNIFDDLSYQYKKGGVSNKILFWNIGAFLLSFFFYQFKLGVFNFPNGLPLDSSYQALIYQPWTLITYAFLHTGFLHLFFNLMIFNYSSQLFLTFFSQKQLLGLYILSAIFAGLCFVGSYSLMDSSSKIVGASGAVMAILVATTTYRPLMEVRLMFLGTIKLWYLTAIIVLVDAMQILVENTGGHIVHIAGSIFGFIFVKLIVNGIDLSKIISNCTDFFVHLFYPKSKTPFKKIYTSAHKKNPVVRKSSIVIKDKTQQQIDDILDKISKSGYDSLSVDEKEFLFKAGK